MTASNNLPSIKGDQLGPWKLGETLGLGSTGKVQLAHNKTTGKQAAIKVISKSVFNNNSAQSSSLTTPDALPYGIEREIIIMKLLNHPNVLRLYDVWETNSNLYMVLEYAEKGELFNLLVEKGPLQEQEAIRFFRQIIIGISYCHALGIVHRDLKPENLLLDHKYNIKIADFGMAALETEDKLLETSCGSPHYAAPEIVSGIPYHGFASDVWSCGVILFALLTGRLPFDEEDGNIRNLLLKVQSGEFEMPSDDEISHEAQDLLAKILTVDPEKRIRARDILKHPLLQKYPSIKDSKSIRNLPREDTYLNPLSDNNSTIDKTILQNLVVLWHGRDVNEIISKLKEPGANAEKTLYALLDRFKIDSEKENFKNEQIRKRQSITSSVSRSPAKKASTPQRRKNRISMISVSSSHKKPASFNRLSSVVHNNLSASSSTTTTPASKKFSMNKKLSMIADKSNSNNSSPTPAHRNKRTSMINTDRQSILSKNKRASRSSKRLSVMANMKRGSITTKLIATYAKLSEDDDWEYIEKETKRTSSDFATLIDEIFEHEKYEQIRKEKEELARKVRLAKEREEEERRRREEEELHKLNEEKKFEAQQLQLQRQMDEEIENLRADLKGDVEPNQEKNEDNYRSVSVPLSKETVNDNLLRQRNFSLQTRPISRLDPGLFFSEQSPTEEKPISPDEPVPNKKLDTEKMILETIRRSKFLGSSFDINRELKAAEKRVMQPPTVQKLTTENKSSDELPKHAVGTAALNSSTAEVSKISDIRVPQFTRKSRHFTTSNRRLSVLSMYSTRQSFSNLVDILKNTEAGTELGQRTPTPHSAGDSEFIFETVNEEAEYTGNSSNDDKLYEVADLDAAEKPSGMKLNFADRFNKKEEDSTEPSRDIQNKLPVLPPLDGKAGLGIYQTSSPIEPQLLERPVKGDKFMETISSDNEKPEKEIKSMIPEAVIEEPKNVSPIEVQKTRKDQEHDKRPVMEKKPEVVAPKQRESDQEKKRSVSFFRKFSGSSISSNKSKAETEKVLVTNIAARQVFDGLRRLLNGWSKYGLKNVRSVSSTMTISGKLSSDNILSLRSTNFEIKVTSNGESSSVLIRKKSGSSKAVLRLTTEIENIFSKEGVLLP
ncbi:hypothetical protein KAFR_0D04100 [Kazachstania africana CBS 2517]|uniref:non-specific serine/threonine protein kinase n=1 Tax=Kazachstania africana (strain ATCC 22294 / BCRC 22015 / CBS 2517 / CECT 1963 / NBRC 1671 / NRRL Y-8276) TaxID=1071382 RepID=H2AUK8_KAZAF|nr:hypothetical protein KAFR_0D04100 [Kazachstania africana CBS 2517]CCF58058.1 hypothetical protein KAFR_0D04100 [Kazachstania africana CBS 2517]